jgi:hypothetical protein
MMRVEFALIREAVRLKPDFERLVLVSGDSLPAIGPDAIKAFFADPALEHLPLTEVQNDPSLRGVPEDVAIERYGWVQPWRFQNYVCWDNVLNNPQEINNVRGMFGVSRKTGDFIRGIAQKTANDLLLDMPPRPSLFEKFYYGAQWWSLSRPTALRLLELASESEITKYFKYFQVPDEHLIHTVLGNDPEFRKRPKGRPMIMHSIHLMSGDTNARHLARASLVAAFREHGCPFARKFDPLATPEITSAIMSDTYFKYLSGSVREMSIGARASFAQQSSTPASYPRGR